MISARKRCHGSVAGSEPSAALRSSSSTSSARPAIFASPFQSGGLSEPLCSAKRGLRRRSSAFTARHMLPNQMSPSANWISVPLIRGEPSRRRVASVLCT